MRVIWSSIQHSFKMNRIVLPTNKQYVITFIYRCKKNKQSLTIYNVNNSIKSDRFRDRSTIIKLNVPSPNVEHSSNSRGEEFNYWEGIELGSLFQLIKRVSHPTLSTSYRIHLCCCQHQFGHPKRVFVDPGFRIP